MEKPYVRARQLMEEKGLDALLISEGCSMRYLSGFTGATGYLLITKESLLLFTDFRYTIAANAQAPEYKVIDPKNEGYSKTIYEYVKNEGLKNVGFESDDMKYSSYLSFSKVWEGVTLIPLGSEIMNLRCIKTREELDLIKMAEHIGDLAFEEVLGYIKPGMTEIEVAAKLEYLLKTNGAEALSFETIVASGINSSKPHAEPGEKKLEKGDFVTMDFGCKYHGYCSDMTRTIVLGKADKKQKEVYETVREAQQLVLDMIKPGLKGMEYDKVARDYIYGHGYEGCFGHGLGHSVGLFIHENPRFSMREETIIQPGITMTVEPGIYIDGFGGVRIEDLVEITEDGYVNYAHSRKDLIEL